MHAVKPNPYSPFADATPAHRHVFAVPEPFALAGATPVPGTLAPASCGRLAVVPDGVDEIPPGAEMPVNACPTCVEAMLAGSPRDLPGLPMPCVDCGIATVHTGLCVLCRQDRHDAWTATRKEGA